MKDALALLISADPWLTKAVQSALEPIKHLHLIRCPGLNAVDSHWPPDEVALVLVHLVQERDTAAVARLLRRLAAKGQPTALIVLGEQYQAKQALTLLRIGAADFLNRPLDLHRLAHLADALTIRARLAPVAAPEPVVQSMGDPDPFLFLADSPMGRVMEQVQRVAGQDATILLTGETGTGKTRLARLIHEMSPRSDEPFLVLHCGALSTSLVESEMFGHVRGAFTGADRDRTGKFAEVGRGTLLLDEIDALPVELQTKLLCVVEERVFEPVGSNRTITMQARLIVASNRHLDQEVNAGRFRNDLYYRLNVVNFHLPPLRDRQRAQIEPLANHFLMEFAARSGRMIHRITAEAMQALEEYHWPGNIRELRNVIERAVALCTGREVPIDDLPDHIRERPNVMERAVGARLGQEVRLDAMPNVRTAAVPPPHARPVAPSQQTVVFSADATLAQMKEEAEIQRITQALQRQKNNRLRAAADLGISRMALYKKLHRYGLMKGSE
jgi:DNA-binding NtrC family response regulator